MLFFKHNSSLVGPCSTPGTSNLILEVKFAFTNHKLHTVYRHLSTYIGA